MKVKRTGIFLFFLCFILVFTIQGLSQDVNIETEIDKKEKKLLEDNRYRWRDMNVPAVDGQK